MRLFIAAELPSEVRDTLAAACARLRARAPGLRWVAPERWHLTLVFLGHVAGEQLPSIAAAVASGARGFAPFDVTTDGSTGSFGSGVLWAGLVDSPALAALVRALQVVVGDVVDPPDAGRAYHAHLTLARRGRPGGIPRHLLGPGVLPVLRWRVNSVVVLESTGGRYVERASAALSA